MKTKVKRMSKRTLALLLGVLMLVTCLAVGQITTANAVTYSSFYIVGDDMGWSFKSPNNKMTLSDGGYYYYYKVTGEGEDKLFRLKEGNSWATGNVSFDYLTTANTHWSVNDIGHGTDNNYWMWDPKNSDGNMAYKANSGKVMYLLYYPDGTPLNSSGNGIVCASKSLPDDTLSIKLGHYFDSTSSWSEESMTNNSGTWSCSKDLSAFTRGFAIEEVYGSHTTKYYKNTGTMTRDNCSNWTMATDANVNCQITSDYAGSYSFSYVYSTKKLTVTYPTIYTVSYTLGSNVTYSSVSGGTKTANGTIKAVAGSNVALTVSYADGYTYDSSNSTINGATVSNSDKTFTFSSIAANESITINAKSTKTALSAPTIKYNNATTTPVSMNAAKGSKARITWDAVNNAGSYEVYKGSAKVATDVNTTYYDIERGNSYGGAYTVKAVPTDATSYSTSAESNSITFKFNKVAQPAPTVSGGNKTINSGTITYTLSGGTGTLGTDYKYQHTASGGSTYSDVTNSSWTTGSMTTAGNYVYKFKTVALATDYYTDSSATTDTITVRTGYKIYYVDSSTQSNGVFANDPDSNKAMTYDSTANAYYASFTVTNTDKFYFRFATTNLSTNKEYATDWKNSYPGVYDVALGTTSSTGITATTEVQNWGNKSSLHYNGSSPKIIVWYDGTKTWITDNATKHNVTITQPTTGGTIKVENATTSPQQFYEDDTVNYTVTASDGYVITGVTVGGVTTSVDRKSSYEGSFTLEDDTAISATVVRQYNITANSATGGSYTVKRGSTTVTTFIAGDSLTLTPSPSAHYDFTKFTVSGGKSATLTANPSTLDTTGATGNITIDPTWTPKSYSVSATAKYSTDGSSYSTPMEAGTVSIAATSGTYQGGVQVTANDVDGYVFVDWYTANGDFDNSLNKQTTFKPNASGAVAVARYKKIFKITSSVDNTGTGAGTVTTSKTSVEAGGSYTITATAKSGSAIESVMVGTTNKGTNASTTINSVSGDQNVVVKFKSNVTIRGGSTIGTNWTTGDAMTSNATGTEFTKAYTNVAGSSSGISYEFKLHNGTSYSDDSSATVTITGGASTGTMTTKAAAGVNWKLTLKQAANVTIKSDGTKITEIKVVPANETKHKVTFKKAANTTITGQYEGVNFSTASADAVVQVYEGDEISFTATADSGKYISTLTTSAGSLTPAFAAGDTYTGKLTNVTSARTVTPTAADKFSVKAVTNKSARGTVTVNTSTAAPGESITITVSPKNGVLKSLTCTYANGAVYTCNLTSKEWTKNATSASIKKGSAIKKTLLTGADTTYTMTIAENSAATINATFDAYSGESTWYYNGYDTSGNALSGYHTKQMTEGMVGGNKFSYYHVEGRSGAHQLMTVSDGSTANYGRVYFSCPGSWNNLHVYFFDGVSWNWPGDTMTAYDNNGNYYYQIPAGAKKVIFNNGENSYQTTDIDLTSTNCAYYVSGNEQSSSASVGQWASPPSDAGISTGTEYFYQNSTHNGDYTGDFNTKGFYNHKTASKEFAKPKDLGTNTGDYYINVLYPNTTYTINGVTKKTGSNPMIIWSSEPLAGDDENVKIYAKDGSIRSDAYGSTYANIADTKIYAADGSSTVGTKHNGNVTNQTYETYNAGMGDTIVIKTQIGATDSSTLSNAADLKAKYYVRGFCVNGEVSKLLEWNANGLYTLTYKVPEDEEISKIEITPIYYLKDTETNKIVTYRVTGFTDELKAVGSGKPNWGDTLYTYPFYGKLGSNNNALGAYPGQPMVYYKGQYQMQIPQKSTAWDIYYDDGALSGYSGNSAKANAVANTNVSGVTMSNGYYDIVHRQIMGYGGNGASADHVQTYDYGDFFKIFNEKKPVDNIVFDFKYRTKKHNFENQPDTTITKANLDNDYGTNGNGFELLTNFHGRTVDLFGTPLSGDAADPSKTTPVYVVSIGGVNGSAGVENIAGYYATEWMVYGSSDGSSYSRISAGNKNSIPPEVLVLNDDDNTSFNTTTYPSADAKHTITDWKALYTSLEAYRGKPVMISYEAADAQIGAGNYATSGSGGATRNDGRWLYSKNGENITSNIKIQYSDDNGANYTDLNTTTPQVSGLSAYFTNDGVEEEMTYSTTIDPDKTFDFEAKTTNANYKFVGWFMEDGTKITTDNASHTERSGSYTFVAKFMQVSEGQLILSHSTDTNDTYKGSGTSEIGVVVKDGEEVIRTYDVSTTDITLDNKIIKSDSNYTIEVTLRSTPTGENTLGLVNTGSTNVDKFQPRKATSQTITFNVRDLYTNTTQNIKSLIYHSYYSKVTYEYDVTFKFQGRLYDSNKKRVDNTFRKKGSLTDKQIANYVTGDTLAHTRYISSDFLTSIAPYEENYGENLTWDFKSVTDVRRKFTYIPETNSYKLTVGITGASSEQENPYEAIQSEKSKELKVTFDLPFAYDSKGRATNIERMTKSTQDNFVVTVNYGQVAKIDPTLGHPTPGATQYDDTYVTAPKVLVDNNKDTYFQYWEVKDKNNKVVTKCYMTRFNFVAYDNYTVAPVYGSEKYVADNDNTIQTSIQFLDTTRNQWNNGGYGNAKDITNSDAQTASDLLFNDFLISFSYKGKEINSSNLTGVNTGFVVQRVAKLKTYSDDSVNTNISDYEESYLTSEESDGNTIKTYIANGANKAYAGGLALSNIPISASELDNKDRVQWYYSVYNSRGWTDDAPKTNYQYKDYVYRAYSYINDNGTVTLSEKPVYFIMYDKAVATNATNG